MALNLADRIAVRKVIVDRCTAVVANYALYLLGLVGSTPEQKSWANSAIRNASSLGEVMSWYVLDQPDYINDGSSIPDNVLKGVVETAINTHFIAQGEG